MENTGVRDSRETAVGKLGKEKDVVGYIQASAFGGTCDSYNLFPSNFNNSTYKVYFERGLGSKKDLLRSNLRKSRYKLLYR